MTGKLATRSLLGEGVVGARSACDCPTHGFLDRWGGLALSGSSLHVERLYKWSANHRGGLLPRHGKPY